MDQPATPQLEVDLAFADGVYTFRLNLPQIDELQRRCGSPVRHPTYGEIIKPEGIGAIVKRVLSGRYQMRDGTPFGEILEADFHAADINQTIRMALIGGGKGVVDDQPVAVDSIRADELMRTYVEGMTYDARWTLAAVILKTLVQGYIPKDAPPPKKAEPAKTTDSSTSPEPLPTAG